MYKTDCTLDGAGQSSFEEELNFLTNSIYLNRVLIKVQINFCRNELKMRLLLASKTKVLFLTRYKNNITLELVLHVS